MAAYGAGGRQERQTQPVGTRIPLQRSGQDSPLTRQYGIETGVISGRATGTAQRKPGRASLRSPEKSNYYKKNDKSVCVWNQH